MKHPERVEDYLEHIAEAIDRATSYLQAMPHFETFQQNLQVQDAVVRNIEIIGEAVNKINSTAPDFIKQHPELPWAQMRGMRNVAIHEYFYVDLEIVWKTVKNDLPRLKKQVDALLRR
jgi:uncharacterized protein with HEPN domain